MFKAAPKSQAIRGTLNGYYYLSNRNVHWYHDYKQAGQSKDRHELYNNNEEFGHDSITDKDRNPHLYWGIWQGRSMIQRVTNEWGYSKELKPEKVKRDFEKFTYFGKLDALDFLQAERRNYPYIDNDARNAIGYNTDDGHTDERYEHLDYGKLYKDASFDYKNMILKDQCDGRPVYEWQVPWGLDEAYGYKEVSTTVDVLGNERANQNLEFDWKQTSVGEGIKGGITLKNTTTNQQLIICDLNDAHHTIEQFHPNTVVMPCGAEKLLTSVRSKLSPSSKTDAYGCAVGVAWSGLWYMSNYWPHDSFVGALFGATLIGVNTACIYRTFFDGIEKDFKSTFSACREVQCNVVLGDWLFDDYDERLHSTNPFDQIANKIHNPTQSKFSLNNLFHSTDSHTNQTGFNKTINALIKMGKDIFNFNHIDKKSGDSVASKDWMESYRDAINNRRLDIYAHVLNNVEGEKIVMPVRNIDNIPSKVVTQLITKRLTGLVPVQTPPLQFDPMYERVEVAI